MKDRADTPILLLRPRGYIFTGVAMIALLVALASGANRLVSILVGCLAIVLSWAANRLFRIRVSMNSVDVVNPVRPLHIDLQKPSVIRSFQMIYWFGKVPLPIGAVWIEEDSRRLVSFSPCLWSNGWKAKRRLVATRTMLG